MCHRTDIELPVFMALVIVQAVSHASSAGIITNDAMLSGSNWLIFTKTCDKMVRNQTIHNFGDCGAVVY